MSNYHVTKNLSGGWKVRRENSQRVSLITNTQKQAENVAKNFSHKSGGGEVRIHGLDGKIRDSDTVKPAHDPYPPKDNKH